MAENEIVTTENQEFPGSQILFTIEKMAGNIPVWLSDTLRSVCPCVIKMSSPEM